MLGHLASCIQGGNQGGDLGWNKIGVNDQNGKYSDMRGSGSYQLCQNRPSDSLVTHIIVAPVKTQI